ncbi:DUF5709 domain-containing protein [Pseudonocardia sp. RS010]|uniref:DUF5709 domain-containing protein n=1 Tax=Pseudonocardia sp. RS010 TaxID=3385979 RepID=UPI0039A2A317
MSRDDNGPDVDTDQLEPEDTLDYRGVRDVLDEGYSPPERPWAVDDFGVTPSDEHTGEDLAHRLAREIPDDWGDDAEDADWESDTSDTDGELRDDQVGNARSGRLVDAAEGGVGDDDADAWARDVGIDGAAASAEEAAVHTVDE